MIADTARMRRHQVHWLDTGNDELLAQLRVLNGFDIDLAADLTRLTNRLRDALTSISPALERAVGSRLAHPGVRDLLGQVRHTERVCELPAGPGSPRQSRPARPAWPPR